ncbi:MAG: V-type ATP synthase subunit A [Oscillospiraceae bacterium]|jgi:V/A-type H+-transporting ATPase subunit A|nr:V-type ATP synthase subunit A [Oscillospiraceae bacterium]
MHELIFGVNGPVVTTKNSKNLAMAEMVYVGKEKLIGEVININSDKTVIQVYEETSGLAPGEIIVGSKKPMSVLLGPGLIGNIFDGIQRPLKKIEDILKNKKSDLSAFLPRGCAANALDEEKFWDIEIKVKIGDFLESGRIYAVCQETSVIEHRLLVPPGINGRVIEIAKNGKYRIDNTIVKLETKDGQKELTLCQDWHIRAARPIKNRLPLSIPLITGQRVIDSLFPTAKGGAVILPGGFGTGKTMTQHQLAKWCDTDLIVYVGCGERGNEMTQVLEEFSELIDPKTGRSMSERTIFIANTSNMPVAAREASIYTGITLAEYYRDMGYDVAMMADSTSRWAEALREISGRLEEMPAEEGFPAYLPSRLAEFYERANMCETLSGNKGSITIIGAVSPQGSDFSEPVTENTKRFTRCFWALDKRLAYARHYPAINWNLSYSEYLDDLDKWYSENVSEKFLKYRNKIIFILREEERLMEIVRLTGEDVLPDDQRLIIETATLIRNGFLQQNAFHKEDTFVPLKKQEYMMRIILHLNKKVRNLIAASIPISKVIESGLFFDLMKIKYEIPNDKLEMFEDYILEIDRKIENLIS